MSLNSENHFDLYDALCNATPWALRLNDANMLFHAEIFHLVQEAILERVWGDTLAYLVCRNITITIGERFEIVSIAPDRHAAEIKIPSVTTQVLMQKFLHDYVLRALQARCNSEFFRAAADSLPIDDVEKWLRSRALPETAEELHKYYAERDRQQLIGYSMVQLSVWLRNI